MSDNATLAERLLNDRAPAIFEAAREAAARITELEATLAQERRTYAERQTMGGSSIHEPQPDGLYHPELMPENAPLAARIAELEAVLKVAYEAVDASLMMVEQANFIPSWDWLRLVRRQIDAAIRARPTP